MLNEKIESLKKALEIQKTDGNWNYDPYMQGMANGIIFALSVLEDDDEPEYLKPPKKWLKDEANHETLSILHRP